VDGKSFGKSLWNGLVGLSSLVAAAAAVASLWLIWHLESCRVEFDGQAPVGLEYEVLEYRPWKFQDNFIVRNLSDRQLTNVVFKVTNRNSGRSIEERIGILDVKRSRHVVTIDRKPLAEPDDLTPTDVITVSCDGYADKSFLVSDLGKKKAFRDVTEENYRDVLPRPIELRLGWKEEKTKHKDPGDKMK
jgi:hypothetical protein